MWLLTANHCRLGQDASPSGMPRSFLHKDLTTENARTIAKVDKVPCDVVGVVVTYEDFVQIIVQSICRDGAGRHDPVDRLFSDDQRCGNLCLPRFPKQIRNPENRYKAIAIGNSDCSIV